MALKPNNFSTTLESDAPYSNHATQNMSEAIAIVGVGMRAPGDIDGYASLWDTLSKRKSHHACLSTDPKFLSRFDPRDFEAMFSITPDARSTLHANLFATTPGLDEDYFGVSKRDSICMDAQQKLLLHVAHEALEDAGFTGRSDGSSFDPDTFGVYIASGTDDFTKDTDIYDLDIYHLIRTQRAFLAGQVSHHFGLHGPAVSVDTVCSGSFTAFNDACRAIVTGECRAALAGGVHVMSPISAPSTTISLKLAGFLDPTGQCKPFLADGEGYCRAEGCGLVVLKRLSDAIREGDRIHGVIRSLEVGNMSSANSIVRPDGVRQGFILSRAVASSGVDPADITFVEAHGPGTKKGDPAELQSICSGLAEKTHRHSDRPLIIGSVKGNTGHSEAASGAFSLFKVLAMMRYQKIAPQANFHPSKLNPTLASFFVQYPIQISEKECNWDQPRRIAVVNNFGASGYAGCMVVEDRPSEYPSMVSPHSTRSLMPEGYALPFIISAKSRTTLLELASSYSNWLAEDGASIRIQNISYATTARRERHPFLALFQSSSCTDLRQQIQQNPLKIIDSSFQIPRNVAFCFSGQGGSRVDPRQLSIYKISSSFFSAVNTCFKLSQDENLFSPEDSEVLELFALQMGLSEMWSTWGLNSVAYAGHSFGEYSALVRAGVIELRDALKLLGIRASLVRQLCGTSSPSGQMVALKLSLQHVHTLLDQQQTSRVELACINSDDRVTLAGMPEDLQLLNAEVRRVHPDAHWRLVKNMKVAYHSHLMEPICDEFMKACNAVKLHPPHTVVLSGLLGHTCLPGEGSPILDKDYLVRHCRETNRFGSAIADYQRYNEFHGLSQPDWIEIGPHSTTIGFMPPISGQVKVPSLRSGVGEWSTIMDSLIILLAAGHVIDFKLFHQDINSAAQHVDLPRYPLHPQPHVYPIRKGAQTDSILYPQITSADLSIYMQSHIVADRSICPASVYMSLVFSSATDHHNPAFQLSKLKMTKPFMNTADNWLQARMANSKSSHFEIVDKQGTVYASMQANVFDESHILSSLKLLQPLVLSQISIKDLPDTSIINARLTYDLFGQTVKYGSQCQGLQRVWISDSGIQAWAISSNDSEEKSLRWKLEPEGLREFSPILIDRAYQLIGFLVNTNQVRQQDEIFVASDIDLVEIAYSKVHTSHFFESYASFELLDVNSTKDAIAVGQVFTFDHNRQLVAALRGLRMHRMKKHTLVNALDAKSQEHISHTQVVPKPTKDKIEDFQIAQSRKQVAALVQSALGIQDIPMNKTLDELGLDSLIAVEIGFQLHRLLPKERYPNDVLISPNTTLATLFEALELSLPDSDPPNDISPYIPWADWPTAVHEYHPTNPTIIQNVPGTTPLFLIHDGSGTTLAYRLLGNVNHTILGVHCPGLLQGRGISGITDAAKEYAALIHQWLQSHVQTRGGAGILVGGWSLGGVIALALAATHVDLVSGVVLMDPPPPGTDPLQPQYVEHLIPPAAFSGPFGELMKEQLKMNAKSLTVDRSYYGDCRALLAGVEAPVYLISASERLGGGARRVEVGAHSLLAWMASSEHALMAEGAWKDVLGERLVGSGRTAGDHFTMFSVACAESTTVSLRVALEVLERERRGVMSVSTM